MENKEKSELFKKLNQRGFLRAEHYYDALEECDSLNGDYSKYMTTAPINCDEELLRLPEADYDLSCALLTMLLREDHFINGKFEQRQRSGQVKAIVEHIITLLEVDLQ